MSRMADSASDNAIFMQEINAVFARDIKLQNLLLAKEKLANSVSAIERGIKNWKKWEAGYSQKLSEGDGKTTKWETQKEFALFMQECKKHKLLTVKDELRREEFKIQSFINAGRFAL